MGRITRGRPLKTPRWLEEGADNEAVTTRKCHGGEEKFFEEHFVHTSAQEDTPALTTCALREQLSGCGAEKRSYTPCRRGSS